MMKQLILLVSICTLLSSCVRTEEIMPATAISLEIVNKDSCSDLYLDIYWGYVADLKQCKYQLYFRKARGGRTYWTFPRILINDKSATTTNQLIFYRKDIEFLRMIYNDIIKLDFIETDGEKIYQFNIEPK